MRVPLDELFTSIGNGLSVKQDATSGGVPISRIETISSGWVNPARVGYAGLSTSGNERWLLQPSDILFSHINSPERVGATALYEGTPPQLIHGMNLLRLRPDHSRIDVRFALHLLRSPGFRAKLQKFVNRAVNQASISITNLKSIEVDLPALGEQRRIAAILDRADALRAKRRQVLAHLDSLTQSIFHDMFGSGVGWPVVPLGSLGVVTTGKTPPTRAEGMFGGSTPFVTPGDLNSGVPAARSVTDAGASASRVVRAGATLVCCIGATIGKTDKARARSAFNQQINAVEWGERIRDEYGLFAMRNLRPTIIARGASTTLPLLPKGQFTKLAIPVPPVELQDEFEARIESVSNWRMKVELATATVDELFSSLQSRAFRGEL